MAKKKLTANQKAWKTAVDKLKRKVRDIGKRGFLVNPDIIPQTRPKRVTKKEIERIEKLRKEEVYKYSDYIDQSTGELVTGEQGRKIENKMRSKKSANTRRKNKRKNSKKQAQVEYLDRTAGAENIVSTVQERLELFISADLSEVSRHPRVRNTAEAQKKFISSLIYRQVAKYGWAEYCKQLQADLYDIDALIDAIVNGSTDETVNTASGRLVNILNGGFLTMAEARALGDDTEADDFI